MMQAPLKPASTPRPVSAPERLHVLDTLRGCAILGMVIVHFMQFNPNYQGGGVVGTAITQGIMLFVQGKAHAAFTILFGVGFAIQLRRADARGENGRWRFGRRLFGVALFGVLTSALAGMSDIILYATSGVWLLFVRRWSVRGLIVGVVASAMAFGAWNAAVGSYQWATIGAERANEAYKSQPAPSPAQLALQTEWGTAEKGTNFFHLARVRAEATVSWYTGNLWGTWLRGRGNPGMVLLSLIGGTLSLLLLGFLALRIGVFDRPEEHRRLLFAVMLIGAAWWGATQAGILQALWPTAWVIPSERVATAVKTGFGLFRWPTLGLESTYIAAATLLISSSNSWRRRLATLFGPAGRMALTNYLLQFVALEIVFANFAFGAKTVTPQVALAAAFIVFGALVVISKWWLARFRFGPAEWVLRTMTYARLQPFRAVGEPGIR